jgi:uroporphyrinogen decarboxylase
MNSRQRILAAINHQEPDRIPIDLGATPSSGISAIAYTNLKRHLNIKTGGTRIYDVVQQLAQPEDIILDTFGIDAVDIGRSFNGRDADWYDITMADGHRAQYPAWFKPEKQPDGSYLAYVGSEPIARMPAGGTFFDQTYFPYIDGYPDNFDGLSREMGKILWAALAHSPWDHAGEDDFWQQLRERTINLRQNTDRALMVVCGCNLFEWGTFLRRMDNFLMDVFTQQEQVKALLEALMEIHLTTLEKVCEAVGDVADILRFGDDLGMDSGPFMSPQIYRELFKPHHTRLNEYVHKNSRMKTYIHSCGSIYQLMPDMIEAGYDVFNPIQTNCADMDPLKLKKEFGSDITFWGGGCDTRSVLNTASPQEVKDHVRERIEILSPGGGFVFNTVHNILPEVPPENIVAMFEAVHEYGPE